MSRERRLLADALAIFIALAGLFAVSVLGAPKVAGADVLTIDNHLTRDGWDPNEPALSPSTIGNGSFGRLFSTPIAGEVYAQPVVVGSTVIVATEHDMVYGIDAITGVIQWSQTVGTPEPPGAIANNVFLFLNPEIGVTSTPVVDIATNTLYVMARTWDGANASSGQSMLHALNVSTGAERTGSPVQIAGTARNDPSSVFNAPWELQRTGLTLLNGWVYAGFGSFGDRGPYKGWIVGVSTTTGAQTLWTDATGASSIGGGIWQSGSGLMSDGSGRLFVATGNGPAPDGDSVLRLNQQPDGTVAVADRFTPFDQDVLAARDLDLGSGGPVALPDSMGIAGHPHLLVVGGKQGITYLLDRDNLGGLAQGPNGADASVAQSPLNGGVFGHAAVWPGEGGYFYMSQRGWLQAWRITTPAGTPTIGIVGNGKCCYRAMSPVVTSNGSTAGSALVWAIAANPSTGDAELQAYAAVAPGQSSTSALPLLFRSPLGNATKFSLPTFNNGRAYVGTYDGHLVGFGPYVPTTTTLSSSANPAVSGQPVTLTATVTASAATPTGTVVFNDGAMTLGSGTLDGSGHATLATSMLGVGSHTITAGYGGAVGFMASTSPLLSQVVGKAATVTSVASSGSPSVFGQPVTMTASVSAAAPGAGTPTGSVVFKDGPTTFATVELDGSANAAITTSSLSIATHPITAAYGGDATFTGSTSNTISEVANQIGTASVISSSGSPSVFGQPVTFTASVSAVAPGTGTPTGSVVFNEGATTLATVALDGSANAAFTTSALAVGSPTITATYGGDPSFATSASSGVTQTVDKATTVLGLNSQPAVYGQSVTFTASLSVVGPGAGTPSGTVVFTNGATMLSSVTVDGSGNATFTSSLSSVGSDTITAIYGDDASFAGSTSNEVQVVGRTSTATVISSSGSPSVFGQPVTFTASVSVSGPGAGTPTGTIVFTDGATTLGSGTLDSSANATLTTSALAVGSHSITATYSSDPSFAGSTSTALTQPVNAAATATVISSSGSPSVFGQPVTFTASVSVVGPGAGTPTGTVEFDEFDYENGTKTLARSTVDTSGSASFTTSALAVGGHTIIAVYGDSAPFAGSSSAVSQFVEATVPSAPTIRPATRGNLSASVAFTASSNGGSPVLHFDAACSSSNGGIAGSATGSVSPIVVTGLTNGKTYTCRVVATNAIGTSASSTASNALVPATVPSSPISPSALPGSAQATATWTAPTLNGGSAVVGYVVTPFLAGIAQASQAFNSSATTQLVTGLTNAKSYRFEVAAKNAVGTGPQSAPTSPITVGAPTAPTNPKAISTSTTTTTGSLVVSYAAGANNGATITSFVATCTSSSGGVTKTGMHIGATAAPITVGAVTTAKTYTCAVEATNSRGTGPVSAASPPVVVGAPAAPSAPTAAKIVAGSMRVTFTPPANNGAPITSYTAICTSLNGGVTKSTAGPASPITVAGLTTTKTYTCTVTATNARGVGARSGPSVATVA